MLPLVGCQADSLCPLDAPVLAKSTFPLSGTQRCSRHPPCFPLGPRISHPSTESWLLNRDPKLEDRVGSLLLGRPSGTSQHRPADAQVDASLCTL